MRDDDIKLPKLPAPSLESTQCDSVMRYTKLMSYSENDMEAYARVAVLTDRTRRSPVQQSDVAAVLRNLLDQVEQMSGMFPDEDGAIKNAVEEAKSVLLECNTLA